MKTRVLSFLLVAVATSPAYAQTNVGQQLELAERDFQRATLEKGVEGWNSFFADSGAQLQNTSHIVRGHTAIKELMGEFLASKTDRLIWWPVATEVSASGDMAYTFGASGVVSGDSTGSLSIAGRGTYLTVWRRDRQRTWKVTADMGGQASARALERAADTISVRQIKQIEIQRSWAIQNRDLVSLERIYSYDFLGVGANGTVVNRATLLPSLLQVNRGTRFRSDVLSVSVAGASAIVTGTLHAFYDDLSEPPSSSSFLHIYVRRNGSWVFVRAVSQRLNQ